MIGIVNSAVARTSSKISTSAAAMGEELTDGNIICDHQHGDKTSKADYDRDGTKHKYYQKASSFAFVS